MQTYRGPVSLGEIETVIGSFAEVFVPERDRVAANIPGTKVVGYGWACGCEARGSGSPFCVWRACVSHESIAAALPLRAVPSRYEGGARVPRGRLRAVKAGDVVVSARDAIAASRAAGSPIGYVENGNVIREFPDGRREVVSSI